MNQINTLNLEKTKDSLIQFNSLSPKRSWKGRVILEIKKEGDTVFLQTIKLTGWKAVLIHKIKAFLGINSNSNFAGVVSFLCKYQTPLSALEDYKEVVKIINSKIAHHNGKKINRLFKKLIPNIATPQTVSQTEAIEKTNVHTQKAICLNKCFDVIAQTLQDNDHSEAKELLKRLEGKENLQKAMAIREWMDSSPALLGTIESLKLEKLELTSLPPEIKLLHNLKRLDLNDNQLTSLPPEIKQLQNLKSLDLESNKLTSLPTEICQLQNLENLYLAHNKLTSLPPEIGQLHKLSYLFLDHNQLTSLPSEIGQLHNLKHLHVEHNQLICLPSEIGQLQNLRFVHLQHNQLTGLPDEIGQLHSLVAFYLGHNKLTRLTSKIGQLQTLKMLHLDHNKLKRLPAEMGQLKKLLELDLKHNQLKGLPPEMGRLKNLHTLYLGDNPFTSIADEIVKSRNPCIAQNKVVLSFSIKS